MLDILCHVENYPPYQNSGAETYLHSINKWLVERGHRVKVMLWKGGLVKKTVTEYVHDGVKVFASDQFYGSYIVDADVVVTHLDATFDTWRMVKRKPILWICHSGFDFPTVRTNKEINILYNGKAIVDLCGYRNPGFVLPPPVDIDHFNVCEDPDNNEFITLVNMNETKGGKVFWKIAEMMPDKQFLGVKGSYGAQMEGSLPNVTEMENTTDMRQVYAKTRLLLMPSRYESYGMVGLEAMANGIPVLAQDTFGLKENLDYAGIFLNRDNLQEWVDMITQLDDKEKYDKASKLSRRRAEEQRPDLEPLEEHLYKLAKKPRTHTAKAEHGHIRKSEYAH